MRKLLLNSFLAVMLLGLHFVARAGYVDCDGTEQGGVMDENRVAYRCGEGSRKITKTSGSYTGFTVNKDAIFDISRWTFAQSYDVVEDVYKTNFGIDLNVDIGLDADGNQTESTWSINESFWDTFQVAKLMIVISGHAYDPAEAGYLGYRVRRGDTEGFFNNPTG